LISLLVSLIVCSSAAAQEARELEVSSKYTAASPLERTNPAYPMGALTTGKEGWVMLSFVISPTGDVTEPMIEDSSGVEDFERAALRAVEKWKYKPATQDGEPVEQAMVKTRIYFQLESGETGASQRFVSKYRQIARLINERDFAAAEPLIAELEFGGRTNLYEDAWFWWAKYVYLSGAGSSDTAEMERCLQRALGYEEEYLTPEQFIAAAERLVMMQARALDFSAAIATFERLRDAKTARRAEGYERSVANLQPAYDRMLEIVDGEQLLVVNGRIGEYDYWVHDLLRRSFSVADIVGRLDVLDIRCERGTRRYSSVPADTVWTVPESWGDCGVYLKGEPGATFAFHEYPRSYDPTGAVNIEAKPAAPPQ
jgi:TonB family protein